MKKYVISLAVLVAVSIGGFTLYRSLTSSSYGFANVNLGSLEVPSLCYEAAGHPRIVCLAGELKKTLSAELLAQLELPYSVNSAQKWSNFPPAGYKDRRGPTLNKFSNEQLVIIKAILKEALGTAANEGYDEIEQILNADDFLKANITEGDGGFSSG